ncbi:MAG TPA: outer membrane beta-barrel protein [Rhodothermales bacterium]|nr:outer membrane beta-barrel protein [Rhodothermales bacterium]
MHKKGSIPFALLIFGLVLVGTAQAQLRPQGSLNFSVGIPQGSFEQHVDDVGFGINAFAGVGLGRTPIVVGVDLGAQIYGFERRNEPFSNTIPDVTVDVETSNSILLAHLLLRIQPPTGMVQPYLDGLFGLKHFSTETSIHSENFNDGDPIASSTNFEDTALSYGVGGGLSVKVYGGRGGRGKVRAVHINAGVHYLLGSEAEYLKEGSIERRDGQVFFTTERSKTDMLIPQLGAVLKF